VSRRATRLPLIVSARDLAGASFAGVLSAVAFSAAECVSKKMPVPAGAATRTDARQSREHPAGDRPIQALGGALDYALMRELRLGAALLRRLIGDLGALLVGGSLLKFRRKVGVWTSSTGGLAAKPAAGRVAQSATLAGPAPTFASAPAASELEANPPLGTPLSGAPLGGPAPSATTKPPVSIPGFASTPVVSALATLSGKPEPEVGMTPAAPTLEATSTTASPLPQKPPVELGFSAAQIATLLARGDALFGTGDVASARLFYERVADAGEAQAALRLAETFDPVFLNQAHLRGVPADSGMALLWYRRARDLGAREVERELKRLERNGEGSDP
jgi:hypothetical protein